MWPRIKKIEILISQQNDGTINQTILKAKMSKNVNAKKPYCKVCHDAGKSEKEYTNHWVKDLSGKTTCPTLLSIECRYCSKPGHTIKFCEILAKNNKEKEKTERRQKNPKIVTQKQVENKKPANGFSALCDDVDSDEEEEEVEQQIMESEYPTLSKNSIEVKLPKVNPEIGVKLGWAAVVAKPYEEKKVEIPKKTGLVLLSDYIKPEVKVEQPKTAPWVTTKREVKKSWADESDSECDSEFEAVLPEVNFEREYVDETW